MATAVPKNADEPTGPDWIKGRTEKAGLIRASLEKRRSSERRAAAGDEALTTLRIQIAPHVRVLQLAIRDLREKFQAVSDTEHLGTAVGYPGLPLNEEQRGRATPEHRRIVEEIQRIPLTGSTARVQYSLACLWARDFRMRSDNNHAALHRCAERLKRAVRHHEYLVRWEHDPDLAPLVPQLEKLGVPTQPDPPPPSTGATKP